MIPVGKDAITMADQFLTPGWYLQPGGWPYWIANGLAMAAPRNDAWTQNFPSPDSKGGILGTLAEPTASLDRSKSSLGGILGALGASAEIQASGIPYWLQTTMPSDVVLGAPQPPSDPRLQAPSPPASNSQALSNLSTLPSTDFDASTPYWLRTAPPSGINGEMFGVPRAPTEQPTNPAPQLWPAVARDASTAPMLPALLPRFFSVPPNKGSVSLWQTPGGSSAEALATPKLDSVFAYDVPAPGPIPTPNYGRQLDDTLTNTWQPDRSAASVGAQRVAVSDMWPLVPSGSGANGQWMSGAAGAEGGPQVIADITPDDDWRPGARYAQNREPPGRGFRPLIIGGRLVEPEPGQASRLFEAERRAEFHIAQVHKIDPTWRPRPSAYESVEGLIRAHESDAEQAQARLRELAAPLPPIIPKESPPTAPERNDIARAAARWLAQNRGHVIKGADWFLEYEPSVRAYFDPPKSLPELQQAISTPKPGYDIHHIVEKTSAEQDGFPKLMINAPENLVRIPRFKHWEITGWYMTGNEDYGGLSPRDYLRGKDWDERTRVGLRALIRHGVLK
jgi:hypothetical protein